MYSGAKVQMEITRRGRFHFCFWCECYVRLESAGAGFAVKLIALSLFLDCTSFCYMPTFDLGGMEVITTFSV